MKKVRQGPTRKPEAVRAFREDHRTTNPGLHNLYVRGAYEDLRLAKAAIEAFHDRSRLPAFAMAAALHKAMVEEIEHSAAFFEAAALLFAGLNPPAEQSK